jgi:multidrug efflux pump subunit AcrA (membrane-fusion protein)
MRFVQLRKDADDSSKVWTARFARLEATVDTASRLLYAVAELDQPFTPNKYHPEPLRRGQFLHAQIEGRSISNAYVLPRYALRGSETVYVLNEAGNAVTRKVSIIKSDSQKVIVTDGLDDGDRVITSPIAYYIEGMPVEVIADE